MAHNLAPSVNCSLDDIDLNALKRKSFLHRIIIGDEKWMDEPLRSPKEEEIIGVVYYELLKPNETTGRHTKTGQLAAIKVMDVTEASIRLDSDDVWFNYPFGKFNDTGTVGFTSLLWHKL
ncbi:hypothetical protein ALC53_09870 [Atta colombica]|uniref:Uncharacterized protein n=1 Tax=Atta colombica TaxID=520822 RepID=A0A151I1X8_9HYME|nr:hypothetical protein ALC53_09870 [Atta colombica]